MPFISEDEKTRFTCAIDTVLAAKILLMRRGIYPEKINFFPTSYPDYGEEVLDSIMDMIKMGTNWEVKDIDTNYLGITKIIMHSPELKRLFKNIQFTTIKDILLRYSIIEDDAIGLCSTKLFFGMDGHIGLYIEYFYNGHSDLLKLILDIQDDLKKTLEKVDKTVEEVA